MHWILIFWIATGSDGSYGGLHTSAASVIFDDQAACKNAYQQMRSAKADSQGIWGVCVPSAIPESKAAKP